MPFHVYILFSESINKFYVGSTDNLSRRMEEHNSGQTKFTSQQGAPWKCVYSEIFTTRTDAVKREKEIKKKKSRKYIEWLIASES